MRRCPVFRLRGVFQENDRVGERDRDETTPSFRYVGERGSYETTSSFRLRAKPVGGRFQGFLRNFLAGLKKSRTPGSAPPATARRWLWQSLVTLRARSFAALSLRPSRPLRQKSGFLKEPNFESAAGAFAGGEGELGDAALVEATAAEGDEAVVLGFGRGGEGEGEAFFHSKGEGDAAVFGGVSGAEIAVVVAGNHIGSVGGDDAGVGSGLGKHFEEHLGVEAEGGSEAEAFGEAGGVDVHHHVHEGFYLASGACGADVAEEFSLVAEGGEDGYQFIEYSFVATAHEVEGAGAGLGDAGGHAGFEGGGSDFGGGGFDLDVDGGADGGAVDEGFAFGGSEEGIAGGGEDGALGGVVGDDGEDHVGGGGEGGEGGADLRADFGGEGGGGRRVLVIDGGDGEAGFFEATGHVGAHATDADKCDGGIHRGRDEGGGMKNEGDGGRNFLTQRREGRTEGREAEILFLTQRRRDAESRRRGDGGGFPWRSWRSLRRKILESFGLRFGLGGEGFFPGFFDDGAEDLGVFPTVGEGGEVVAAVDGAHLGADVVVAAGGLGG
jgi:hypothetical protein